MNITYELKYENSSHDDGKKKKKPILPVAPLVGNQCELASRLDNVL